MLGISDAAQAGETCVLGPLVALSVTGGPQSLGNQVASSIALFPFPRHAICAASESMLLDNSIYVSCNGNPRAACTRDEL